MDYLLSRLVSKADPCTLKFVLVLWQIWNGSTGISSFPWYCVWLAVGYMCHANIQKIKNRKALFLELLLIYLHYLCNYNLMGGWLCFVATCMLVPAPFFFFTLSSLTKYKKGHVCFKLFQSVWNTHEFGKLKFNISEKWKSIEILHSFMFITACKEQENIKFFKLLSKRHHLKILTEKKGTAKQKHISFYVLFKDLWVLTWNKSLTLQKIYRVIDFSFLLPQQVWRSPTQIQILHFILIWKAWVLITSSNASEKVLCTSLLSFNEEQMINGWDFRFSKNLFGLWRQLKSGNGEKKSSMTHIMNLLLNLFVLSNRLLFDNTNSNVPNSNQLNRQSLSCLLFCGSMSDAVIDWEVEHILDRLLVHHRNKHTHT